MEIILAGYNIDSNIVSELKQSRYDGNLLTPETIAAAYARISRDERPVNELRILAAKEVEKARLSNQKIVFEMGHGSIAEHVVFNIDILNVSRLVAEELEKSRLASYTEKSQRYVLLTDDFTIPQEIRKGGLERDFVDIIKKQNDFYHRLYASLREHVFKKYPDLARERANFSLLEGWAKEDARYVIALATETQLGMTVNARSLERIIRHLASQPREEARECSRRLYEVAVSVAPSLIRYVEPTNFDLQVTGLLKQRISSLPAYSVCCREKELKEEDVRLTFATPHADEVVVAALLHSFSDLSWQKCTEIVKELDIEEKREIIRTSCQHMCSYDSVLREFENAALQFELTVSAACFAQLKRHRMASLTVQKYDPRLGVTVPPSVVEIGMEGEFHEIMDLTEAVHNRIEKSVPEAGAYVLTNAHRRRVSMSLNARELYHIARLREDRHAQWDIRRTVAKMMVLGRQKMPLTLMLACGKDNFGKLYEKTFSCKAEG